MTEAMTGLFTAFIYGAMLGALLYAANKVARLR